MTKKMRMEIGLLKVRELTEGGYRLYDRADTTERLRMVKEVNEGYLSLAEVKAQLN
jgi:DNA-binding transcriptional MerR regulator